MMRLPGVLAQIAEIAGEDAAIAIARARGGTQIYLPPAPKADHWLSELIGHEAALAVADQLTGGFPMRLDVPCGPTNAAAQVRAVVDRMLSEGRSETEIARETGYSARGIRRRRAMMRDRSQSTAIMSGSGERAGICS